MDEQPHSRHIVEILASSNDDDLQLAQHSSTRMQQSHIAEILASSNDDDDGSRTTNGKNDDNCCWIWHSGTAGKWDYQSYMREVNAT
jgi:hypothetical protein